MHKVLNGKCKAMFTIFYKIWRWNFYSPIRYDGSYYCIVLSVCTCILYVGITQKRFKWLPLKLIRGKPTEWCLLILRSLSQNSSTFMVLVWYFFVTKSCAMTITQERLFSQSPKHICGKPLRQGWLFFGVVGQRSRSLGVLSW